MYFCLLNNNLVGISSQGGSLFLTFGGDSEPDYKKDGPIYRLYGATENNWRQRMFMTGGYD